MALDRITKLNFVPSGPKFRVYDYWYNILVDKINALTSVTEASTKILTAVDSGKTFWIDDGTAASTFTLPTPEVGLKYKFIWTANCNNAFVLKTADTTDTTGDMLRGGLLICSAAAVNTFLEAASDTNTLTIDDNAADKAGGIGSWVEVICTEDPIWFVTGVLNSTSDNDSAGAQFSDTD